MSDMVKAPWNPEEVRHLNDFQHSMFHPFTCAKGCGILEATPDGWICRACGYVQDWAHRFMIDGSWRQAVRSWDELVKRAEESRMPLVRVYSGESSWAVDRASRGDLEDDEVDVTTLVRYPEWDWGTQRPRHPSETVEWVAGCVSEFLEDVAAGKRSRLYLFTLSDIVMRTVSNLVRNRLLVGIRAQFAWVDNQLSQILVPLDVKGEMLSPWPDDMFETSFNLLFHGIPRLRPQTLERFINVRKASEERNERHVGGDGGTIPQG